jgi:AcrR family transcriptional regulator
MERAVTKVRGREQLIEIASKVFARKGYRATTLEDVAAEFGILRSSLYYHVANKAELYAMVTERRLLDIAGRLLCIQASELNPPDKVAAAVTALLHQVDEFYPESSQWGLENIIAGFSEAWRRRIADLNERVDGTLHAIIKEGIETGDFAGAYDAKIATLGILGMCNWVSRWYCREGRLSIDQIRDSFVALALGGLCATRSRTPAGLD